MTTVALLLGLVAADPARELIHFGPAGPTRVRLVAGDVDARWAAAVGKLFALLDRDGNGTLSKAEQAPMVAPTRRPRAPAVAPDPAAVAPLRLEFPGDGPVDAARFAAAVRAAGLGPLTLAVTPPRADAEPASAALFKRLDGDGDGRLVPADLADVGGRLAPLDADEDECLTPAELLDRPPPPGTDAAPVVGSAADQSGDLLLLDPTGGPAVKQVLAARGPNRATALRRPEFGADEKPFAALDVDRNGRLDSTELAAWLDRPPDAEVSLAAGGGVARPGLRLRLTPPAGRIDPWAGAVTLFRQNVESQLKGGPIDRKAAEPMAAALLDLSDRSGDGKLDAAEAAAGLAVLDACTGARLTLTVADHGTGLFDLLDRDGDGRLSPRELLGAKAAVEPFLVAGSVGPADLPRRLTASAGPQPMPLVLPVPVPLPVPVAPASDVPGWFTGLDRNRDGDVSRREFVGPDAAFRRLDADGDGLISPAEARNR